MTLIYLCPGCNLNSQQTRLQYVDLTHLNGKVSIMCWDECGMDFDVSGIWFFLNSWRDEK